MTKERRKAKRKRHGSSIELRMTTPYYVIPDPDRGSKWATANALSVGRPAPDTWSTCRPVRRVTNSKATGSSIKLRMTLWVVEDGGGGSLKRRLGSIADEGLTGWG